MHYRYSIHQDDSTECKQIVSVLVSSSFSFSVGTGFIIECMWFSENFMYVGLQSKLSGVFTVEIFHISIYTTIIVYI